MKPAKYFFGPLRRKIALNVCNNQNQNAQENHDFYGIVDKELNAAADPAGRV